MPKMKTHRGAAKRFKKTGTGKIKRSHAFTSHLFVSTTPTRKRQLRHASIVSNSDAKRIKQLLTYL